MSWSPARPLPEAFKALPRQVYADDPSWIPEDPAALDVLFSERHAFFEHGRATVEVVDGAARLAGFFDPGLQLDGRPVAFFGCWESVDVLAPNRTLFARVARWARQQGAAHLYGPIDFSTFRRYRLRTSAPEGAGCFPGEPYNPPYYPALLERLGFTVAARYVTQASSRPYPEAAAAILAARAASLDAPPDPSLRVRLLTPRFWMDHLPHLYPLVDATFGQNFAYTSISYDTFEAVCGRPFARRFCPHTSQVVLNDRDEIVGFFLAFPDYGPLVRQGNPQRLPLAEVAYDTHFDRLERPTFLAKTLGIHPDYRRQGLLNHMATEAVRRSLDRYYDGMICLMKSDNVSTRYGLPFADRLRTYALYAKAL